METYGGSGDVASPILNLDADGMSGQLHVQAALPPKEVS
jgi:hypothetical protein